MKYQSTLKMVFTESDEFLGEREITVSRKSEETDLQELLYFFSESARALGFTCVQQVGVKLEGTKEQRWSEF